MTRDGSPPSGPAAEVRPAASETGPVRYSTAQRYLALAMGVVCHGAFAAGVLAMATGLYTGLHAGHGTLTGPLRWLGNGLLLGGFAVSHSVFLSQKGRRWLARTVPLGIGREVGTTTFATLSSLQLLAAFWWWSPGQGPVYQPGVILGGTATGLYAASWLFLFLAMKDAGLGIQMGYLGWYAVWKNRRPDYGTMPERGTFRHTRQPIYLAFTLILWTGPVWTVDHAFAAGLWTLYCVFGPRLKERRNQSRYGPAFERYREAVPYFLPSLRRLGSEKGLTDVTPRAVPLLPEERPGATSGTPRPRKCPADRRT